MSKRKTASSAREPVTATEMAEFIAREIRSLMVQAQNNRRRLEALLWISARLSAGIKRINEYITKLKAKAHDNGDSQP
jgi:hypothetical protein